MNNKNKIKTKTNSKISFYVTLFVLFHLYYIFLLFSFIFLYSHHLIYSFSVKVPRLEFFLHIFTVVYILLRNKCCKFVIFWFFIFTFLFYFTYLHIIIRFSYFFFFIFSKYYSTKLYNISSVLFLNRNYLKFFISCTSKSKIAQKQNALHRQWSFRNRNNFFLRQTKKKI